MKKQLLSLLTAGVILTGCASTQIAVEKSNDVSSERIYKKEFLTKSEKRTTPITFVRDSGFVGGGCNHIISIDNYKVAALKPKESVTIYLESRDNFVRVETAASSLCPYAQTSEMINVLENVPSSYRIAITPSLNDALKLIKIN
ncbi:hypothetical protein BS636_04370 [Acinetobacter sp. LoGeW2-3]|uniref:hypothetical protein n=1 Tax=Acinetobacter sp. LoGeW2-3 TaxID=1808001 RepID=UPI000C058793|nr:hypothetical protein [Acinetobacter sp. LoGeW2-3]ATO18947.1 hypothetical protein BS636_04370 [Acinetobacter sp. LoGeW2-3]